MSLMPGAVDRRTFGGAARSKGRAVIFHVSVTNSKALAPSGGNSWHLYVAKSGVITQYVDSPDRAYANVAANGSAISVETEGGTVDANNEPWTGDQCESLARIAAWANESEGVPLELMTDSLPASRGIGYHRLGIDPWRVPGGEVWSASRGKICPGQGKILQIPGIVNRARELRGAGALPGLPAPVVLAPPAVTPAARVKPLLPGWVLPASHYYGDITGPPKSHGGYYPTERPTIQAIQAAFIYLGCVPGVSDWQASGWDDGKWEDATDAACAEWHRRFYPGQPQPTQVWADDYRHLAASLAAA